MSSDDRADLVDLMARFAHGIDRCDWTMYRSVFTDEFDLDYSSWRPESIGRWRADDWVARAAGLFPGLTGTQHALTNLIVEVSGDSARVRAAGRAEHALADDDGMRVFTLCGWYDDRCRRTPDGWRIAGKRLNVEWTTGDATILDEARRRVAAGTVR
jgi:hypothetical protein